MGRCRDMARQYSSFNTQGYARLQDSREAKVARIVRLLGALNSKTVFLGIRLRKGRVPMNGYEALRPRVCGVDSRPATNAGVAGSLANSTLMLGTISSGKRGAWGDCL